MCELRPGSHVRWHAGPNASSQASDGWCYELSRCLALVKTLVLTLKREMLRTILGHPLGGSPRQMMAVDAIMGVSQALEIRADFPLWVRSVVGLNCPSGRWTPGHHCLQSLAGVAS